ncbi:MAG: peptidase S41 [Bacteroidales bacterium]|nr:peptidase S41 [Bacteroidales bacterium]
MMKKLFLLIVSAVIALASCSKDEMGGISSIDNPRADKQVARYGETVTVTFQADGPWEAEIVLKDGEGWAEIAQVKDNEKAGKGTVRIRFARNEQGTERVAELYVTVSGGSRTLVGTFTQAAGDDTSAMSAYLNQYMHNRLVNEYLWADEYSKLDIDMEVSYDKFLYTHLTKLGDLNIEDGGYYRDYSSSAGERYIYSYISEVATTKTVPTKAGELTSTLGLGIGPLFASVYQEGTNYIGLTVGYVYPGSPAEAAGLRRGDTIYQVGGNRITKSNYQSLMNELFYTKTGSYSIAYARYVANDAEQRYDLVEDNVANITAASYGYNPILFAAILTNGDIEGDETAPFNIGYMASESFDSSAQEVLEYQIQQFIDAGITELVLDLRYNVGGEVQQSRYLSSSIVGRAYDDQVFFKAEFNDGKREEWKFLSGPSESDKLGKAPAMNLKRLWVIMSENTASASELVIAGLRGVDFPVTLIGSQSEGKNVGMVVTQEVYNGRRFEFAPITYRGLNAKNEYGPKDGFEPDPGNLLNNQNSNYRDDVDNMFPYAFGDWGNFDFNIALYCCFCDIIGLDRPDYGAVKSDSGSPMKAQALQIQQEADALEVTVMKPQIGRFGNVIYR